MSTNRLLLLLALPLLLFAFPSYYFSSSSSPPPSTTLPPASSTSFLVPICSCLQCILIVLKYSYSAEHSATTFVVSNIFLLSFMSTFLCRLTVKVLIAVRILLIWPSQLPLKIFPSRLFNHIHCKWQGHRNDIYRNSRFTNPECAIYAFNSFQATWPAEGLQLPRAKVGDWELSGCK